MAVLFGTMTYLSSCKKDDAPSPVTVQLQKLSTTWKVSSVINDNQDVTSQYAGFLLIIDELNYTAQNGGNPWPASGTYTFQEGDLNTLQRSDGTEVTIDEITDKSLILSFNYNALSGGRLNGITGNFTFSFTK